MLGGVQKQPGVQESRRTIPERSLLPSGIPSLPEKSPSGREAPPGAGENQVACICEKYVSKTSDRKYVRAATPGKVTARPGAGRWPCKTQ